jgi:hypothetical protein
VSESDVVKLSTLFRDNFEIISSGISSHRRQTRHLSLMLPTIRHQKMRSYCQLCLVGLSVAALRPLRHIRPLDLLSVARCFECFQV